MSKSSKEHSASKAKSDAITSSGPSIEPEDGHVPELGIPKKRIITLRLVSHEDDVDCNFWVGLSKTGPHRPSNLMDLGTVTEIFAKTASEGIKEEGPLMLTDSRYVPPRFIYILPIPNGDFREKASWIQELVETVKSWAPTSAGFYLAPELIESEEASDILQATLLEIINNSAINNFHLLVGSYGVNTILNSALALKADLVKDDLDLMVFH